MRRSLLDFIACPVCLGDLELRTDACATDNDRNPDNKASNSEREPRLADAGLPNYGIKPSPPEIKSVIPDVDVAIAATEIVDGLLACRSCARWYPVRGRIPELYPDHLRDWPRDLAFLRSLEPAIGFAVAESLRHKTADNMQGASFSVEWTSDDVSHDAASPAAADPGRSWKKAEMDIATCVDDPDFFSPGRTAPFNPADPEYTTRAIRRFGVALSLLDLKPGAVVLDAGTGYAWTSEWLSRSGYVPIGLDICRTYLEIGLRRMGDNSPHLIAADVENLPLKTNRIDAVLAFDAFHHVPDRPAALAHFFRALKTPGRIVLAEPGPGHGTEPGSVEVMKKYGILEKGLSFRDVKSFIRNLPGATLRRHHVFRITRGSFPATLKTGRDLVHAALYAVIHIASVLLPARLRRALQSPKTLARLKKTFRYSDYRFYTIDKKVRLVPPR